MVPDFEAMQPYYTGLLGRETILAHELPLLDQIARRLFGHKDRYLAVQAATSCYWPVIAVIHERESSGDFRTNLAQGDSLQRPSVHVPRGRPPLGPGMTWPVTWEYAAEDAVRLDHLDRVPTWSLEAVCYWLERYNGFGYWARHQVSPYLWAGSTVYTSGKFTADGHYDATAVDRQLGAIPLIQRLARLDQAIHFVDAPPLVPTPALQPGKHLQDVFWLQQSLNAVGANPQLRVDGSFGRKTRWAVEAFQRSHGLVVDGVVGPITIAALETALAANLV